MDIEALSRARAEWALGARRRIAGVGGGDPGLGGRRRVGETFENGSNALAFGRIGLSRATFEKADHVGKGLRWTRERVKSARTRAAIAGRAKTIESPELLNMNAAARYSGVSDTTIRKLVDAGLIRNEQTIPWAPWEIPRGDLERDAVKQVLRHLQTTGRLVLTPTCSSGQQELF